MNKYKLKKDWNLTDEQFERIDLVIKLFKGKKVKYVDITPEQITKKEIKSIKGNICSDESKGNE